MNLRFSRRIKITILHISNIKIVNIKIYILYDRIHTYGNRYVYVLNILLLLVLL